MYECLTGRKPFVAESLFEIMGLIVQGECPPPSATRPEIPKDFEAVVLKAMHKDAPERFESVHKLGAALVPFAGPRTQALWASTFGLTPVARITAAPEAPAAPVPATPAPATPVVAPASGDAGSATLAQSARAIDAVPAAPRSGSGSKVAWIGMAVFGAALGVGGMLMKPLDEDSTTVAANRGNAPAESFRARRRRARDRADRARRRAHGCRLVRPDVHPRRANAHASVHGRGFRRADRAVPGPGPPRVGAVDRLARASVATHAAARRQRSEAAEEREPEAAQGDSRRDLRGHAVVVCARRGRVEEPGHEQSHPRAEERAAEHVGEVVPVGRDAQIARERREREAGRPDPRRHAIAAQRRHGARRRRERERERGVTRVERQVAVRGIGDRCALVGRREMHEGPLPRRDELEQLVQVGREHRGLEHDEGVEPIDPRAQELARRWFALVGFFTGGDPGIFQSLKRMYQNEDKIRGMDVAAMRPMMAWIEKASAAAGIKHPGS